MLHLRILVPTDLRRPVLDTLDGDAGVVHVSIVHDAALIEDPLRHGDGLGVGDVIEADLQFGSLANVMDRLGALGVARRGAIDVSDLMMWRSDAADRSAARLAVAGEEIISWDQVAARTSDDVVLSRASAVLMSVAGLIAAVGILGNNPILLVGAMIVSPDFGPLAGFCLAVVVRARRQARDSALSLLVGFSIASITAAVVTLVARLFGSVPEAYLGGVRPVGDLISSPGAGSFVVALAAGVAGMISLGQTKSGAVVGVLVSVTTIPAAANIGVALAMGDPGEAAGAFAQLMINLGGMAAAGVVTLRVGRSLSARRSRATAAIHGTHRPGLIGALLDSQPAVPGVRATTDDPAPAAAREPGVRGFIRRLRGDRG